MLEKVIEIAREAGELLRSRIGSEQKINLVEKHDLKLQTDVDCQRLIAGRLSRLFPGHYLMGEEESQGDVSSDYWWVVDPLDGTVNYAYGVPHFGVSIGLLRRCRENGSALVKALGGFEPVLGVVYDPMRDEMFSGEMGAGVFLNGKPSRASSRGDLADTYHTIGFSKSDATMEKGMECYRYLAKNARKVRIMGSAALDFGYVSAGRVDAYLEFRLRLWDFAAGLTLVQEAGGRMRLKPLPDVPHSFAVLADNGKVDLAKILNLDFFQKDFPAATK